MITQEVEHMQTIRETAGKKPRAADPEHRVHELMRILKKRPEFNVKHEERVQKLVDQFHNILEDELRNEEFHKLEIELKILLNSNPIARLERDREFAETIEQFENEQELEAEKVEDLIGFLERRHWGNINWKLHQGDRVAAFLVPGADFLTAKFLNDNPALGFAVTDTIAEEKRHVLEEVAIRYGLEVIQSDFKGDIVRIPKGNDVDSSVFEKIIAGVDEKMSRFIEVLVGLLLRQAEESGNQEYVNKLNDFLSKLRGAHLAYTSRNGYKETYGVSTVDGESFENKIAATSRSLQKSRMVRDKGIVGGEFSDSEMWEELSKIDELKKEIQKKNVLKISEGGQEVDYEIFDSEDVVTLAIVQKIRKGELKAVGMDKPADQRTKDEQKNVVLAEKIIRYVKKINIFDIPKPFIASEVADFEQKHNDNEPMLERLRAYHKALIDGTKAKLSLDDRKNAAEQARTEEKDARFTSRAEFHKRAAKLQHYAYVFIDAMNVGARDLQRQDKVISGLNKVRASAKGSEELRKATVAAGDKTTLELRDDFRGKVFEIVQSKLREWKLLKPEEKMLGLVGGDELLLAFDLKVLKQEQVDSIMFAISEKVNARVVQTGVRADLQTAIGRVDKFIGEETDEANKVKSHYEAVKRAEMGAEISKKIEAKITSAKLLLKRVAKGSTRRAAEAVFQRRLRRLEEQLEQADLHRGVVVVEVESEDKEKEITFMVKTEKQQRNPEEVLTLLDGIINKSI